jgi:chemotaxis protein methyltransferase CheR
MGIASGVDYGYLRQLVFGLSQNVLDPSRDYLFETRLTKLLRNQGMTQVEELVQYLRLRKNPELERSIAEAMTINETSFFRDSRPFELLRIDLLPKMIEARRLTTRSALLERGLFYRPGGIQPGNAGAGALSLAC